MVKKAIQLSLWYKNLDLSSRENFLSLGGFLIDKKVKYLPIFSRKGFSDKLDSSHYTIYNTINETFFHKQLSTGRFILYYTGCVKWVTNATLWLNIIQLIMIKEVKLTLKDRRHSQRGPWGRFARRTCACRLHIPHSGCRTGTPRSSRTPQDTGRPRHTASVNIVQSIIFKPGLCKFCRFVLLYILWGCKTTFLGPENQTATISSFCCVHNNSFRFKMEIDIPKNYRPVSLLSNHWK